MLMLLLLMLMLPIYSTSHRTRSYLINSLLVIFCYLDIKLSILQQIHNDHFLLGRTVFYKTFYSVLLNKLLESDMLIFFLFFTFDPGTEVISQQKVYVCNSIIDNRSNQYFITFLRLFLLLLRVTVPPHPPNPQPILIN